MNDTIIAITAQDISQEIDTSLSLVDRLKFAMHQARNHWMAIDDEDQIMGAIGAVLLTYPGSSEEYIHIKWELEQIRKLSLILTKAQKNEPYDVDSFVDGYDKYEPIGIMKLWRESKR